MIYEHLFSRVKDPKVVVAGLIGGGDFGSAIVSQGSCMPRLKIQVVADINIENARSAFKLSGISDENIALCSNLSEALKAMELGKYVIVIDAMILMDLPLHVITTATRSPEAGALYAYEAIKKNKHVIMVDKEADSVIGPILKRLADQAGVVYTTDDGDEPGLLMGLVGWARSLGFEVLSGGKTRSVIYDKAASMFYSRGREIQIAKEDLWAIETIPEGEVQRYTEARHKLFQEFLIDENCGDPICHMAVAANGTGLLPDVPSGHRPVLTWRELPEVLCPIEDGGINNLRGTVDTPVIIGTEEEPNYGGGVYAVVTCGNKHSLDTMKEKGIMVNRLGTVAVLYRPYHLCGVETTMSIICAGLLGVPTGASEILQRVDMICTTLRDFKAGESFGPSGTTGWNRDMQASMVTGFSVGPGKPIPFFMLEGNCLAIDVPAGNVIVWEMIIQPKDSLLWKLRQQQDEIFLTL